METGLLRGWGDKEEDLSCFVRTQLTVKKIYINLTYGLNSDKFPIHKDLVLPRVYDHRLLYEHHIRSDADIAYNRKWF
jgi:hypothetical protein